MKNPTRILLVEDVDRDAILAKQVIGKALTHCEFQVVATRKDFLHSLETFQPNVIMTGYNVVHFGGMKALKLAVKYAPLTPCIVWASSMDEDAVVECMKAGAKDYVLKGNARRLGPAILRSLKERQLSIRHQQAEEKHQAIFDDSIVGIFQSSPEGRFLKVNAAMARIYGYDSAQEMIRTIKNIATDLYVEPQKRDEFITLLHSQNTLESYEQRNYRKDGSVIWTSTSARVVRDPDGTILYYEGFITDITARKHTEQSLQERERQLSMLFSNLPGPVYRRINDTDYTMEFISNGITELSGYQPEDFRRHRPHFAKIIHPEDRERIWMEIQSAVESRQPFELTYRILTSTGEEKWVWDRGQCIWDEAGRLQALEGFITDITERKQAEDALQNNEKRFRALIENGLDNISLLTADGTLIWESPAAIRMLNYAPDEHVGENIFKLMHPDDLSWTLDQFSRLVREPGSRQHGTFRLRHSSGAWLWVEAIVTNMLNQPGVHAIVVNYRDITQRKQAEEALHESQVKYQSLVETSHDLIWSTDPEGYITFVNRAAKEIFGYEPGELLGRHLFDLMDSEYYRPDDFPAYREMLIHATEFNAMESYARHRDGRQVIISSNSMIVPDERGNVTSIVGSSHDITMRKQVEDVLKRERNLLRILIDNLPDRIYAMDAQGRKVLSNTADWKASGGKTMEDVIGKTDFDLYPSDLAAEFWRLDQDVLKTGTPVINYEEPGLDECGNRVSVLTTKIPLRDEEGRVTGLVGIGRDVTQRKQVEARIKELLDFNEKILNHSPLGILTYKLTGECIFANQNAALITGATVEQLQAQNFHNLDSWKTSGLYELATRAIATQTPLTADIHVPSTFGRDLWMTAHCVTFQSKDEGHLLLTIADITGRKQAQDALRKSEENYRAIFEGVQDAIFVESVDGQVLMVNERACEMFGYSRSEFLTKTVFDLVPEGHPILMADAENALLTPEPKETVNRRANGDVFPIEVSGRLLEIAGEKVVLVAGRDITERKRIEESLRAEREKAQTYLNTADVVMLALDQNGNVTLINQKGCELLGYSPDEIIGKNWITNFLPEDIRDQMHSAFQALLLGRELMLGYYENAVVTKSGEERLIAWHNSVTRDGQGNIMGTLSSGEDITERKKVEMALQDSNRLFRTLFEASPDAILLIDPVDDWPIIDCNTAACQMNGYSREEMIGQPIDMLNLTTSEPAWRADYIERIRQAGVLHYESPHKRKDGSVIMVDISTTIIRFGNRDMILGIDRDATERKQAETLLRESEERFSNAFEYAPIGIGLIAPDGHWLRVNQSLCELVGYSQRELLTKTFQEITHPDDLEADLNLVRQMLTGEVDSYHLEKRYFHKLGHVIWVLLNVSLVRDHDGKPRYFISQIQDITERKRSEAELRASEERFRQLADNIQEGFWMTDAETGQELYVSPAMASIWGRSVDVLMHEPNAFTNSVFPEDRSQVLESMQREKKGEKIEMEYRVVHPDGSLHWIWDRAFPILDHTGRVTRIAGIAADITERKHAEEVVQRRAQETSALLETSLALTNLDLKTTLRTISNSAKSLFTADGCRIFLMEPDGETLRCVLALQERFEAFSALTIKLGQGVTGAVAASGRAEIVNEMQNDPRSIQVPGTPDKETEAIMFAPLKEGDRAIGVLSIRRVGTDRFFNPADLELLEAFAAMAASAVSNARLFEETQRRLAELEALYENGLAVGRLLKPGAIGNRLIETFARYLSWHHVAIRIKQEDSDDLDLVAFSLPNLEETEQGSAAQHFVAQINKVGQGLSGRVIQTGKPLRTGDVHAHPEYIHTHPGIQSGLYMPLKVGERVIGVVSVESEIPNNFSEQDERLLATLASQAAIAFENARLYETVQRELLERKRAEEALRSSEVHYRELADSITDILFELDQDLKYSHWNKASEALTGIPAERAIGKSMREIFGETSEQGRIEKIYDDVLRSRQPKTFETTMALHGAKRFFEINAYPSRRGVSVVAKDVTDRKRAETIMQKRFELMEYSVHHTLNALMQKTTDEVSELTGSSIGFFHFVETDQNTLGMQTWSTNALQLFHVPMSEGTHLPLDQAGVWAEAVRQRRPLIQNDYQALEHKHTLPQGHVPIQREIVIPILRADRVVAVMGIANKPQDYTPYDLEIAERLADYAWDITERKQMEIALETERNQLARRVEERTADLSRANSNLARALRVKDEFLANMSHELRTPLNAILGLSESLGEQIAGPLNEKQQKYITTISESGHHLLALINDILDLAKIEAGQITLDINKVDIHSVCQASLRMIKQLAQKKNQDVSLSIENGLGLMWADERRLKQMMVNLLGNAVKFTPQNGRIGLEVHGDREANKVTITVWDNGIGIKEDDLARLFQPFVQLDSGLDRETSGTGLGLALVAQMARLHGGSVSAVSEQGQGSRFSIVLPWEPVLAVDNAARLRATGKFPAIKLDGTKKPTILLVEDTREVIMMIQDYLEMAGYKIVTAQDGTDAIVQAKLVHPDLILMDVQMPRMNGLEATRKLRGEPEFRYTPIIALTALAMPNDRERCLAAGMDEYISKPINLKALVRIIQSCLFSTEELRAK